MEMPKREDEDSRETDNSTNSDDPDKDESEDFLKGEKHGSKIFTPQSNFSTGKFAREWSVRLILLVVAIPILVAFLYPESTSTESYSKSIADNIKSHIKVWQSNYPNQNHETWYTIAGQMEEFVGFDHMSPLVLVMAYNEARKTTNILASEVSRAALILKNGIDECGDMDDAKISGSDKRMKPGFLLNNFVPNIKKCRKMIVFNLEELDGAVAKDLHSLLDPDYHNIPNIVYIFTVKIHSEGNVSVEVQNKLRNHWGAKIPADKLNPLLSRLVNYIKIIPEPVFES